MMHAIPTTRATVHANPSYTVSMSRTLRRGIAATAVMIGLVASSMSASAQSINLTDNETPFNGFGKGGFATFGQTFTAPTNFLQTFSFWLGDDAQVQGTLNAPSLLFQAYVMEWDAANSHATGPVLYSSSVFGGPTLASQRYDFLTTNLSVSSGTQYVAFLSASASLSDIAPTEAYAFMETTSLGTYTGGSLFFADNGSDLNALSTDPWQSFGAPESQAHFSADFSRSPVSTVPEPSSLVLLVAGMSALMVLAVRKKRV